MEYRCDNQQCEGNGIVHNIIRITSKVVNSEVVAIGSECPTCGEYMVDITPHDGFGIPKKAKGDRTRKFYDRGKSQKIYR